LVEVNHASGFEGSYIIYLHDHALVATLNQGIGNPIILTKANAAKSGT
jgi:hypothetical protein